MWLHVVKHIVKYTFRRKTIITVRQQLMVQQNLWTHDIATEGQVFSEKSRNSESRAQLMSDQEAETVSVTVKTWTGLLLFARLYFNAL